MKRATGIACGILLALAGAAPAPASGAAAQTAVLAFPGAQGFGANATGGRGGDVYYVTNLNDSGPGSFRDAVSRPDRTVVFAVGGIITIDSRIVVSPDVTIAGQTAPGGGITIYGNGLSYSGASNTITRYIRVRMGVGGDSGKDAITIASGDRMMFDHISVSWGRDETFSISGEDPSDITISNSIIGQGLDTHSCGGLIQTTGGVSLLRNLYIDNHTRNPKVKGVNQFVNNVVYNWRVAAYILGDSAGISQANVVGNYFIAGPSTDSQPFTRGNENFQIYAEENYHDNDRDGVLDGYLVPRDEYTTVTWMEEPFPYPEVPVRAPQEAYDEIVASVGASSPRDRVDSVLIDELTSLGTAGQIIGDENAPPMNGPGPVEGGTAPEDTDRDGMPDAWEAGSGLDPDTDDHNGDQDGDGYTNLEEYLSSLVD